MSGLTSKKKFIYGTVHETLSSLYLFCENRGVLAFTFLYCAFIVFHKSWCADHLFDKYFLCRIIGKVLRTCSDHFYPVSPALPSMVEKQVLHIAL